MMNEGKEDLKELTLAITLLAGISAVLLTIVDYSNKNIISETNFSIVYLLVLVLILEVVIVVLFLLLKGYSIWPIKKKRRNISKNLSGCVGIMMFFIPIFVLIWIFLAVAFSVFAKDWDLSSTKIHWCNFGIVILSALATLYLGGVDLEWLKNIVKQISLKIKPQKKFTERLFDLPFRWLIILVYIFLILVFILSLFQTTAFLLCGSYSTEVTHFPDANTDIMSLTIKDTGIPSGRCYIELQGVNNSNENLFQLVDNITLQESVKNSSYMTGKKKGGIYYLFIDTSNLPSDNYFLHAEVTVSLVRDFDLFTLKKYDDNLFYLPPKNKTENIFNQTSIL